MESILTSIKKMLGIEKDYDNFDEDIIIHINSVFPALTQIGVGPSEGFSIEDDLATWVDFMGDDPRLNMAKSYMYLRVKLLFDPPSSSTHIDAMERTIDEFEWRLNVTVDPE